LGPLSNYSEKKRWSWKTFI